LKSSPADYGFFVAAIGVTGGRHPEIRVDKEPVHPRRSPN
jgi:hypothetical protein